MPAAPTGTPTFLFTDIAGSTRLWEKFPNQMGAALARHDAIVRNAVESHRGYVFKTVGDAFCAAFHTPREALEAAIRAQRSLRSEEWTTVEPINARMGIHTGTAEHRDGDYFGGTLNRTARIEAAAHGGQILVSQITYELLRDDFLDGIGFKSLGNHRLRNLDRPEHLFQVVAPPLPDNFPPPRSLEVLPNNLPAQSTSFVGREREIDQIRRLLEKTRLLTLTGTGGTGKTRLSLELGAQLIDQFPDGVWLVELAQITEPDRAVEVTAAAVGAHGEPGRPLRETLIQFLRGKKLLLLLDNCEHIQAAAARLALDLLRAGRELKILATSRHSLGIPGETTFPVPPLAMLDLELEPLTGPDLAARLSQYEAVKLFIDRAVLVRPDFAVTNANAPALAEICSRLDGIPLAIELAAARVRVLDLQQIASRLDDRFRLLRTGPQSVNQPHQQTLQALIDWSHDLLSEKERILFRRLSAFVGGRTLEALEEAASGDGIDELEVLDLLQQLVEKSLVNVEQARDGTSRYTMIESVWQYARDKLEASEEFNALRDRHLTYFLKFAQQAAPHLEGADQKAWLDRCQLEIFNFRFAFEWAIRSRKTEAGYRLTIAIHRFLEIRGNLDEARDLVRDLTALPDGDVPASGRAEFRLTAGELAWAADRYVEARQLYLNAESIYQSIGDAPGAALTGGLLGFLDRGDGELEAAQRRFEQAVTIGRQHGQTFLEALGLSGLGSIALDRGDLQAARDLKEQGLTLYKKLQDHWVIGLILWGIVHVAIAQKDYARARSALEEWTAITRELGNQWMLPHILACHAELALETSQARRAVRCLGASEVLREHFAAQFSTSEQTRHQASLERLRSMMSEEEFRTEWEAGRLASPWSVISGT